MLIIHLKGVDFNTLENWPFCLKTMQPLQGFFEKQCKGISMLESIITLFDQFLLYTWNTNLWPTQYPVIVLAIRIQMAKK